MVDFVGLLRKTIDAQRNADQALRGRVYARTRETIEKQMTGRNLPASTIALQRHNLEKAIAEVEAFYQEYDAEKARHIYVPNSADDAFDALQRNAGMRPPQIAMAQPQPANTPYAAEQGGQSFAPAAAGNNFMQNLGPYGAASAAGSTQTANADMSFAHASPDFSQGGFEEYGSADRMGRQNTPIPVPHIIAAEASNPPSGAYANYANGGGQSYAPNPQTANITAAAVSPAPDFTISAHERDYGQQRGSSSQDFLLDDDAYTGGSNFTTQSARDNAGYGAEYGAGYGRQSADMPAFAGNAAQDMRNTRPASDLPFDLEKMYHDNNAAPGTADTARDSFSPMPDFLNAPPETNDIYPPDSSFEKNVSAGNNGEMFNLDAALAGTGYAEKQSQRSAYHANTAGAAMGNHSDMFAASPSEESALADVLLPDMPSGSARDQRKSHAAAGVGALPGDAMATGIFAQAAMQEKLRSGKQRMLRASVIIAILLTLIGGAFWFLTDFLHNDKGANSAVSGKSAANSETADKAGQRLMPDGQEVNIKQPAEQSADNAASNSPRDAVSDAINAQIQQEAAENSVTAPASLQEAPTALMPATDSAGKVSWSLLHEKAPTGENDTVLRGEISIPDKDMVARLTFRPNHDATVPAVYLAELMFILPEEFEGKAVDKISPLMLKDTEQSTPRELQDMHVYGINNNFFVVTMGSPAQGANPSLQRNIAMLRQLPLLCLNLAYKNGRIAELTFSKAGEADALFKQFFDAQPAALRGMPAASAKPA